MRGQTVVKNASDSAFASFLQFLLGSLPVSKKDFLVKSSQLISFGGGLVMVLACGLCFLNIVISGINSIRGSEYPMVFPFSFAKGRVKKATMAQVRMQLGDFTALGLEILVVADVLETLLKDTHEFSYEELGKIAAIALCRTLLAWALSKELEEVESRIKEKLSSDERGDYGERRGDNGERLSKKKRDK